jgi:hypothetical protein
MFLLLLVACEPPADEPEPVQTESAPAVMDVEVVPATLDFGALGLGESSTLPVAIYNHGEGQVVFSTASANSDAIGLDAAFNTTIPPGGMAEMSVTWSPTSPATLSDTIDVSMRGEGQLQDLRIEATGIATGPALTVSLTEAAFGTVSVGCESVVPVILSNVGTSPLVVENVALTAVSDVAVLGEDGELAPFPWTLAPSEYRVVHLVYTPMDEAVAATLLEITSDDPVTPVTNVRVEGVGFVEEDNTVRYEVLPAQNVTVVFALNAIAVQDARLAPALPVFFDTLSEGRADYRVSFLTDQDGVVVGDEPYIDETMSTENAMEIADQMLARAVEEGDNDYLLQTFDNALAVNRAWLLDESAAWASSRLNFIAMNSDQEQSLGNATVYVLSYQSYKAQAEDVAVHAITGDFPRGCSGAEPAELLYNAATETDGTFLSWCTADWAPHMEALALASLGPQQVFAVTGDPAAWSIEVRIDGARLRTGWTYDEAAQAIVFDASEYPSGGSEVRIDYIMAVECP